MKRSSITLGCLMLTIMVSAAQPNQQVLNYIETYRYIAIQEMVEYRIPASITMAQGIIESGSGLSTLAKESNNHFGIKCHTDWKGEKVYHDDDAKGECFRKYDAVEDSYRDHSIFLSTKPRYAALFELDPDDYKAWAKGLKDAGYATNPKYADMLIKMIEEYALYELDKMTLADLKKENKKQDKEKSTDTSATTDVKNSDKEDRSKEKYFDWNGYAGEVYYFNRIPTITAKADDTPELIAEKHKIKISLLRDYNDIEDGRGLEAGQKVYLQPKRKRGNTKIHVVKPGETMYSISRDEGVRMTSLYKYNKMQPGEEPAAGEEVFLKGKRRDEIQLLNKSTVKSAEKTPSPVVVEKRSTTPEIKESPKEAEVAEELIVFEGEEEIVAPEEIITEQEAVQVPAEQPKQQAIYHTVEAKETLYALSKKYAVTIEQLQKWNNLADTAIGIGQQLIVGFR